ncbi:MAG: hypothetical protein HYX50_02770 [Chloroflexi bacterium]|nr:hypothetical protein [Chloroflexota bacterium]
MTGNWVRGGEQPAPRPGVLLDIRAFELHGTPYRALRYRFDDDPPDGMREARISADMLAGDPLPGDRVLITAVLGVVDRIAKAL